MKKGNLIIDNTGFDKEAMAALTEAEFINIHKDVDCICKNKTAAEKTKWLKDAYKAIKVAAAPVKEETV